MGWNKSMSNQTLTSQEESGVPSLTDHIEKRLISLEHVLVAVIAVLVVSLFLVVVDLFRESRNREMIVELREEILNLKEIYILGGNTQDGKH